MRFTQHPAILPAVGMACGVLLVSAGDTGVVVAAAVIALGAMLAAPRTHRLGVLIVPLAVLAGIVATIIAAPAPVPASLLDGRFHTFRGRVVREQTYDGRQRLVLSTDSATHLRLALSLTDVPELYAQGDLIRVNARVEASGKTAVIPFNADYNRPDRVGGVLYARPADVQLVSAANGLARVRSDWLAAIHNSGLSARSAELLASAWLGTHDETPEVRRQFRAAGLSHLLCVSGFHLGLLSALVLGLFLWLNLLPGMSVVRYVLAVAVAWGFAFLVGFQPTVIRAAVMLTVYFLARICERGSQPLNSLAVAVMVILLINPYWLYSVGFQLSVAAVAGIILLAQRLNPVPRRKRVMALHRFGAMFALPLAALIATAPVVLWHFHSLPLLSIPVNALAVLLFPSFMTIGALCVILSALGLCPKFILSVADWLCDFVCKLCDSVSALPTHSLQDVYLSPLSLCMLVLAVLMLVIVLHHRGRVRLAGVTGLAACLMFAGCEQQPPRREMVVYNNMYSTVLAFRVDSVGLIVSPRGYVPLALERYFTGHGISPQIVDGNFTVPGLVRRGNLFAAGQHLYCLADKHLDSLPLSPDLVILARDAKIKADTLTVPHIGPDEIAVREF